MLCWAQSRLSLNLKFCKSSKCKHLTAVLGGLSVLASLSNAHFFVVYLFPSLGVLFCHVLVAEQDTSS